MKQPALTAIVILALLSAIVAGLQAVNLSIANPGPATQIAPVVKVSEIQINAKISQSNETLWAIVDRTDLTNTVYGFGDQYQTENYGMGLLHGPEKVTVTVAYDRLDAQYPVPVNATNIHLTLNNTEIEWAFTKRTFHLFDTYLPELHWKILSVPESFLIHAHYEHPVLTTDKTYAYLGEYAFLIPLGQRYGLQEVVSYAYSEYPWFTNSSIAKISIEVDSDFTNMHVYSIDGFGTLTLLNYTDALQGLTRTVSFTVSGQRPASYETTVPYGVVVVFDPQHL